MVQLHTIQYRGRTLTSQVSINPEETYIREVLSPLKTSSFDLVGFEELNFNTRNIAVVYNKGVIVEGEVYSNRQPAISDSSEYERFFTMNTDETLGYSLLKPAVNTVSQFEIAEDCIFFNSLKNFEPLQPITYDLTTTETGVTVTIVDKPLDSSLVYTLDNPLDPSATWTPLVETEIALALGDYGISILNPVDGYPFYTPFKVGV